MSRRRAAIIIYYAATALLVVTGVELDRSNGTLRSFFDYKTLRLLGPIAGFTLLALAFAGPFLAQYLLAVVGAKASAVNLCSRCRYNLTGNVSGICPECGTPIREPAAEVPSSCHPIKALPWRIVLPAWLLAVVLVAGLLGYIRITEAWQCSECCRREFRVRHQFGLPFGGPVLFEISGGLEKNRELTSVLTPLLDPREECPHNWVCNGSDEEGMQGWRGTGPDLCRSSAEYNADYMQFLDDHPGILDRIRSSIRRREPINDWLATEYYNWRDGTDGATSDGGGSEPAPTTR